MKDLEKAIDNAKEFIFKGIDKKGLFKDFKTNNHKESVDWVSAYIALNLLKSGVKKSLLEDTAKSLYARQNKTLRGWGYNELIVPDADSTAYVIMFLSNFSYKLQKAKGFLLQHQKSNGSFSTYTHNLINTYAESNEAWKHRIENETFKGWHSGIVDITATLIQAIGYEQKTIQYIKENQTKEGFWRSYWYNDDVYATFQSINALRPHGFFEEIKQAQNWLSEKESKNPFYLALIMQGLMINGNYKEKIDFEIKNLVQTQQTDGSWSADPILRFPSPDNLVPWNDTSRWREDIKDQNRLFTTSTCLKTLFDYKRNYIC